MVQEVSMDILIRSEESADIDAIEKVTLAAFTGKFSDNPTEHLIVNGLRDAGALSLSLVAEVDEKIVGHVAFSLVTVNGENLNWYGLGPISVVPELQKQGVGSKLIHEGLSAIRALGAKGCVLEGSPVLFWFNLRRLTWARIFYGFSFLQRSAARKS
jgi:putative acetyltransferase